MASKKSYSRYFIILQEDERGFGLSSGKTPTGYAKIEIKNSKCKISYYVQNLKPDDKYSMLLICGKKGCRSLINIGNINLDEQGRADVSYEYDEENIGGSNTSVDKVRGASIARIMDNNVISLMSGFITTDIPKDWKTYNIININDKRDLGNIFETYEEEIEKNKQKVKEAVKESKVSVNSNKEEKNVVVNKDTEELEERENIKDNINRDEDKKDKIENEKSSNGKEQNSKKELHVNKEELEINKEERNEEYKDENCEKTEVSEEIIEKNKEEIKEDREKNKEEIKEYMKENKEEIKEDRKENIYEHKEEFRKNKCYMNSMEEFFENLGEGFKKYVDIFPKIQKSVWYKIDVEDIEHMCDMSNYQKYVVMHYPMIKYYPYIKEYKHYLVGYKYDENCKIKYIMYAIPGNKSPNCQPFKGKTGFVTWMKSCNLDKNQGYWIMFYDFKNYNILIPIKKNK